MGTEIQISPEGLQVAQSYLKTMSSQATSEELNLPLEVVHTYLKKREVKTFVDNVFMEQGYMNRHVLQSTLSKIITAKLKECDEADIYSTKDIADLLAMAHKFRMDEIKAQKEDGPLSQVNIQNNFGENYGNLMRRILEDANQST